MRWEARKLFRHQHKRGRSSQQNIKNMFTRLSAEKLNCYFIITHICDGTTPALSRGLRAIFAESFRRMKTFDEWKNICASNSKAPLMIAVGKATVWVAFVTIHDHLPVMKLSSRMLLQSAFLSIRNGWELILRNALPFTVDLIVRCSRREVSVVLYANLNSELAYCSGGENFFFTRALESRDFNHN